MLYPSECEKVNEFENELIKCPICFVAFEHSFFTRKYCSVKCRTKAQTTKQKPNKKSCANCQKIFYARREAKYCSHPCSAVQRGKQMIEMHKYYKEMNKKCP